MIKHGMKCFPLVGLLSGLNNNVQKGLADNVHETIQMHMVIAFVVDKSRLIIVLNNFGIGRINHMTSVTGKNGVIFEFVGSPRKG